jgi:peptidoglycan-associated lipoprotein
MSLAELNAQRPIGDVFFDYDKATLREEGRVVLQKGAEFLRLRMSVRATIEGHADERGTNEYNLALGERRANAARDYLISLGITGDRLQVLGKGEEAPACTERNEECWQRNRRGTFVITAK